MDITGALLPPGGKKPVAKCRRKSTSQKTRVIQATTRTKPVSGTSNATM